MKVFATILALVAVVSAVAVPLDKPNLDPKIDAPIPNLAKRVAVPSKLTALRGDVSPNPLQKRGFWSLIFCEHDFMRGTCWGIERNDVGGYCVRLDGEITSLYNNILTSLEITGDAEACCIWDNADCTGKAACYWNGLHNNVGEDMNDLASSFACWQTW